ncbi:hypothetical protein TA3x_002291 [Tundrisphaera sp. TA3]|uniref:hypothetical protein n=1 Tax=Tundrisphaera sp. TA3 TaxID=3435775 RepID=UPI003EBFFB98
MATAYTTNVRLQKPAASDRHWDVPINANVDLIDGMTAIGGLAVTTAESPSTSLAVRVAPGSYVKADGTVARFAGTPSLAIPPSSTAFVWLTDAGVATAGTSYPASAHLRLARVVSEAASISQVADDRVQCAVSGTGLGFVARSGDTVTGPLTVATPATGTPLLTLDAANRTVGFFGATPATQAAALTLLTSAAGVASDSIADVGSTHSQAVLNNNFASLTAKVDALINALKRHGLMGS